MPLTDHGLIIDMRPAPKGWYYIQAFHGSEARIPHQGEADSGAALVQLVIDFRVANGIPIGDPEYEVAKFIKAASPANDRWHGNQPGAPRFRTLHPLIDEIRESIEQTALKRPRMVLATEAVERGEICLKCKHNVKWETTCGDCVEKVKYLSFNLRLGNSLEMEEGLRACRLHKLHLPSGVFLDRDFLPARHEQAPSECWVKK